VWLRSLFEIQWGWGVYFAMGWEEEEGEEGGRFTRGAVDSAQGLRDGACVDSQWEGSDRMARIADVAASEGVVLLLRGAERRGGLVDAESIFFSDLFSYFSSSGFVQNLSL
jgi:hypothetical protein